jgi:hypothetical protein
LLGEDDEPMGRSHGAPSITTADYGHIEQFSFSNATDRDVFDAIHGNQSVRLDEISIRFG